MYKVKETIIVEGTYDKIKLSGFIDGVIFTTNGFGIFARRDILKSIKTMAEKTGIVILTDSDSAGFKIRSFVKQYIPEEYVRHAYVPEIKGKEKRKARPGKEGILGVEGISEEIIIDALKKAGCTIDGVEGNTKSAREITKADFYAFGLSGGSNSAELRRSLARELGLPTKISANMLLDVVNRLLDYDEFSQIVQSLR